MILPLLLIVTFFIAKKVTKKSSHSKNSLLGRFSFFLFRKLNISFSHFLLFALANTKRRYPFGQTVLSDRQINNFSCFNNSSAFSASFSFLPISSMSMLSALRPFCLSAPFYLEVAHPPVFLLLF